MQLGRWVKCSTKKVVVIDEDLLSGCNEDMSEIAHDIRLSKKNWLRNVFLQVFTKIW